MGPDHAIVRVGVYRWQSPHYIASTSWPCLRLNTQQCAYPSLDLASFALGRRGVKRCNYVRVSRDDGGVSAGKGEADVNVSDRELHTRIRLLTQCCFSQLCGCWESRKLSLRLRAWCSECCTRMLSDVQQCRDILRLIQNKHLYCSLKNIDHGHKFLRKNNLDKCKFVFP